MQRTQISLTAEVRKLLDNEASRTGRSISALIRDAVENTYGTDRNADEDYSAIEAAFGAWIDRQDDGRAYVERLRSGDRLNQTLTQ
ncbi:MULTISPECIES: CopG family transcriptional regulator [unclassified Brevibacterium]|uniref:ribbon-helix-helix domain-containing protein n=1 Tax=unclassified Brevibacterium TaxID=2614124 RepID=UPI0010931ADE|nr:CopG family transcriptional regulator [Brevibacterium sp. S22]TGD26875.1 CopG family transcriptional regulator [Brevibacterium sp. S22]